jgi:hypothetical protein
MPNWQIQTKVAIGYCSTAMESINIHAHGRFGMTMHKMAQHVSEFGRMLHLSTVAGFVNIFDDHRPDALGALRLVKEVTR